MSKKNRETDRAGRAAAALAEQQRQERRRRNLMVGGVVAALVVIVAIAAVVASALDTSDDVDAPAAGSEFGLTIGSADAPHEVVIYEDFHCVHCADFEEHSAEDLAQLAADGQVLVEYRPIHFLTDYSARAANAFKVVLDESGPEVAKEFHDLLFQHYDEASKSEDGLDDDTIIDLAVEAGADESAVRPGIEEMAQQAWVDDATAAAQEAGVSGTPTILLDGEVFQDGSSAEEMAENLIAKLQ